MMRAIAVAAYVVATVMVIVSLNADAQNYRLAYTVWPAASLTLGWLTRRATAALLPLIALPIAVPFGFAEEWLGSDAPMVWWIVLFASPIAVAAALAGLSGRALFERFRASHR